MGKKVVGICVRRKTARQASRELSSKSGFNCRNLGVVFGESWEDDLFAYGGLVQSLLLSNPACANKLHPLPS